MTIDQLDLNPHAQQAAQLVLAAYPDVVFTSGRRDARGQARAMAANTIRYGVAWLGQTYKNQAMVQQLEAWMEQHLDQIASINQMGEGFYQTLVLDQAGALAQFPHCRGDAFDAACPRFADGRIDEPRTSAIKQFLERLPSYLRLEKVLSREGAHRVIHAQFYAGLVVVQV
jgi:hypothetical protein